MRAGSTLSLACILAGCSLFTDLSGFDADAGADASADASDAAASAGDAGTDALTLTGEPDARVVDAGPCGAAFCDDFDTPPVGAGWTGREETGGGIIWLEDAGRSVPNALRADSPPTLNKTLKKAYLYQHFDAPKGLTCSFAIHPLALGDATEVFAFSATAPGWSEYVVFLSLKAGTAQIGVAATPTGGSGILELRSVPAIPTATWTTITFATDWKSIRFSENGVPTTTDAFLPAVTPTLVHAQLGITFHDAATAFSSVRFDDMGCTAE